ncbi:MAG TPA: extracellular solute-binding protein [Nevskiaceae bacterium]
MPSRAHPAGTVCTRLLAALLVFASFAAFSTATRAASDAASHAAITLYAGQHQQMVRLLVDRFEKETGIPVKVRYGSGPELAHALTLEGKRTTADVFFTEDSPELMLLQEKDLLAAVDPATLHQIPARFSSADGKWVGVLARENVLTWNPKLISADQLPKSLLELAQPRWKDRFGIHLTSADIMPLIRAIAIKHGRPAALDWVKGVKRNAKLFQRNSGVVLAVNNGDVPVGVSNSYYYYRLREQVGADKMVSRVYHFANGDVGGLIDVSGAAALRYAPHPQEAQRFLAFMVSEPVQDMLARGTVDFEYPLRPGVVANPALKPFSELQPPDVTVTQLGDNREALQLLQEAGAL